MAIFRIKFKGGVTHKPARRTRFRQKVTVVSSEVILARDISRNLDRIEHLLSAREKDGENEIVKEDVSLSKRKEQTLTN
jgi:hypothetical protein